MSIYSKIEIISFGPNDSVNVRIHQEGFVMDGKEINVPVAMLRQFGIDITNKKPGDIVEAS